MQLTTIRLTGLLLILFLGAHLDRVSAAPSITQQPSHLEVAVGHDAQFTVQAAGINPLTYQWRKAPLSNSTAWQDIPGATASVLLLTDVQLTDDKHYFSVRVSDSSGTAFSNNALLVVRPPIVLSGHTAQPEYQVWIGNNVPHFNVHATRVPHYQSSSSGMGWRIRRNGTIIVEGQLNHLGNGEYQNVATFQVDAFETATFVVEVYDQLTSDASDPFSVTTRSPDAPWMWGSNVDGQLDGPIDLSKVVDVAAGKGHTLALMEDGTVLGWGGNSYQQATIPVILDHATAVGAGWNHSLSIRLNGGVIAWGDNSDGQCDVPRNVLRTTRVAGGRGHSLALHADGTVSAWGRSDYGQTVVPSELKQVIEIAAGADHSLALKKDGTVVAWGRNDQGQCGVPVGLTKVVAIAAGFNHSLALKEDGTVVAWGGNEYGQITTPIGLGPCIDVAAGNNFSAAVKMDRTVQAWGASQELMPVPAGLPSVHSLVAGADHLSAIPYHDFPITNGNVPNYPVEPWRDVLVVYNSDVPHSKILADHYIDYRPGFKDANILGVSCPTLPSGCAANECTDLQNYQLLEDQIRDWLDANQGRRIRFLIMMLGLPTRLDNAPTGGTSISYLLHNALLNHELYITHVNMTTLDASLAYVDKLALVGSQFASPGAFLQVETAEHGNTLFLFEEVNSNGNQENAWSRKGHDAILELGYGSSLLYTEVSPYYGTWGGVLGYFTPGYHSGALGGNYPTDGSVKFGEASDWYLMVTAESFNGIVASPQGTYDEWFSFSAFNVPSYGATPVGAVAHTMEPSYSGVNNTALYFGMWLTGKPFAYCAWGSQLSIPPYCLTIGDPLVGVNTLTPRAVIPRLSSGDFDAADGFTIRCDGAIGNDWILQRTGDFLTWSDVTSISGDDVYSDVGASGLTQAYYRVARGSETSENAVGFVRINLAASGATLVSMPFYNGANSLDEILPVVPDGSVVHRWDDVAQQWRADQNVYIDGYGWYGPELYHIAPGEAFFVTNPESTSYAITVFGEVPTGSMTTMVPSQVSYRSAFAPVPIGLTAAGYQAQDGDAVYVWDSVVQGYASDVPQYIDGFGWYPSEPMLVPGGGVLLQRGGHNSILWEQQFEPW